MMDAAIFEKVSGVHRRSATLGGQELILFEILALLYPYQGINLPCDKVSTLHGYLLEQGKKIVFDYFESTQPQALYMGTPTIVEDRPLFPYPDAERWTKEFEREFVRSQISRADEVGYGLVVTGLGSGDISVEERIEDMGAGTVVVCKKEFQGFTDWVLARRLR